MLIVISYLITFAWFRLNELIDDTSELWLHLITKMVTIDPLERPSINAINIHPAFWNKEKILTFLQVEFCLIWLMIDSISI